MAGLYIHIPFCKQKCHYCNFFSVASQKYREAVFDALLDEMDLQKSYLKNETLETIYFGGGTPSLYSPAQIEKLITKAALIFGINAKAEITLEANPDDINASWLRALKATKVNRLSIGIQSFRESDLKYLHRSHNAEKALEVINLSRDFGFDNLSIDLIYGIPGLNNEAWIDNLNIFAALKISHLSAYALTVEAGTALDLFIKKGKYQPVSSSLAAEHFDLLMQVMEEHGYEHYEISNFARPGHYARHNTAYWQQKSYLGIGPSAHSYNQQSRQWNVSAIKPYLEGIEKGQLDFEKEMLSEHQKFNEYVMTSLRTMWGMDLQKIEQTFGATARQKIEGALTDHISRGHLETHGSIVRLTNSGKHFADGIAADLFIED